MDRFLSSCGARRMAAFALAAMMMLCPAGSRCEAAAKPVFFAMLFPQLMPDWSRLPWVSPCDEAREGIKTSGDGEEAQPHEA